MSDHAWGTVGDFVTLQRGTTYRGDLVGRPGPALLGLGSIVPGGGFRPDFKTFGGECPPKLMLGPGDIYVALKGATKDGSMVGSVARVPYTLSAGRLTQDTARLDFSSKDPEHINHVYWVLRTPQYRDYCNGRVTGSASASFSRDDFLAYPVPPMTTASRKIVSVLEAIEAKTDLNRQMSETLEAMARTLFHSWFVDFDPVRAKSERRHPSGLDVATAALFPDSFEHSPVGPIPKGWRTVNLYETARYINGAAFKNEDFCDRSIGMPVIKIAELKEGITSQTKYSQKELGPDQHIDTGDMLYSWSGSPDTSLDVFRWAGQNGLLNQHIFNVHTRTTHEVVFVYYLFKHLRPVLVEIARNKQTTGLGHVTVADMRRLLLPYPPEAILTAFYACTGGLFDLSFCNKLQAQTLAAIRDSLLPKLLSGELRVPQVERMMEVI